ncbi:hypothetical protein ACFQQB_14225 [Nonomuraea rubra]|uniref:hypothetical protein n=1 Tax=Nonomuraea rubra TaxID=46180 RepID=UPI0036098665
MADEPLELGEMSFSEWYAHTDKMAEVGFLTIARKLPSLIGQAMRMAWRASPATRRPRSCSTCSAASSPRSACWPPPAC